MNMAKRFFLYFSTGKAVPSDMDSATLRSTQLKSPIVREMFRPIDMKLAMYSIIKH